MAVPKKTPKLAGLEAVMAEIRLLVKKVNHIHQDTDSLTQLFDRIDSLQSQVSFLVEREQERRAKEIGEHEPDEDEDGPDFPFQEGEMVQFQKFGNTIHGEVVRVGRGDNGLCVGVCWVEDRRGKTWAVSEDDLEPFTPPKAPNKKGRK